MAKHIDPTVKQAALEDIKSGMKVSEASLKHGVTVNAIYLWLKAQADNTGTSSGTGSSMSESCQCPCHPAL